MGGYRKGFPPAFITENLKARTWGEFALWCPVNRRGSRWSGAGAEWERRPGPGLGLAESGLPGKSSPLSPVLPAFPHRLLAPGWETEAVEE